MKQEDIDQAEWQKPGNWRGGWLGLYCSRLDSRLWVPKRRPGRGWTVNAGHRAGRVLLVAALLLVIAVLATGILLDR
ncbi:DUF5808 domain-containing protein [Caldimonas tepidiphila]|uniref:DUF5808 domain-containing protein n=1 Tax=Caldimonas tepidiphila TaxID=2315841 RepID=UPI000E5A3BC7|nr:DUF5808 domain-containing protein [Caldimonas tepidiphila]